VFERFTEQARQVVVLAQEEARMLNHNYIGTEHLLLGLLREEESLAARVLESLEITLEWARAQVTRLVGSSEEVTSGEIPFTPRAKKVLELALREALSLGHNYIGPEHILLGVVRENEGVAARILLDFGADSEKIRNEVIRMLSGPGGLLPGASVPVGWRGERRQGLDAGWLDGLGPLFDRLAADIRQELGREPDPGDLLLALACARETLAARALSELGVDLDALWGTIERVRRERSGAREELMRRIQEVCRAKEQAIEAQEFANAARLRDQERELREQARAQTAVRPEVLREIHRHLGIPGSPDDATNPPDTR
jgi:Clp amino terminal domain, pathogenicity island component/UvrB/uvrC motif